MQAINVEKKDNVKYDVKKNIKRKLSTKNKQTPSKKI